MTTSASASSNISAALLSDGSTVATAEAGHSLARINMVSNQLRPNQVSNPQVQRRFTEVDRVPFVSPEARDLAYIDEPVLQGTAVQGRREMFSPLVAARLIQALAVQPADTVLVVAGGTGFSSAILSGLAAHVTLQEEQAELLADARTNLAAYTNVTCTAALPQERFDAILLDAPMAVLPQGLGGLLNPGGRIAGVVAGTDGVLEACVYTQASAGQPLQREALFETRGHIPATYAARPAFAF